MMGCMKLGCVLCVSLLAGCAVEMAEGSAGQLEEQFETNEALSRRGLSPSQEATALKLIDDICGDTWCEGDHNFSFEQLECAKGCRGQAGSCRLTFRVFSHDTDIETGPTYTRSCRTEGFTGFGSLVESHGEYQSLVPAYYDALTQCISQVEEDLPG